MINLKQFLIASGDFTDGDKASGHEGWQIEIDLDKESPGTYSVLCYTTSGENTNDQLESFYESCANGVSGNTIVAYDYEIPFEAIQTRNELTNELYKIMLDGNARSNIGIRVTNTLMDVQKIFKGSISISASVGSNELMKMSGTIKHYSGGIETISPIPIIPAP